MTEQTYYQNDENWGSYQFVSLSEVVNNFMLINNGNQGTHSKGNTSNRYTRAMRRFLLPTTNPRVLETGLAMIETTEGSFTSTTNTIDYVSYD